MWRGRASGICPGWRPVFAPGGPDPCDTRAMGVEEALVRASEALATGRWDEARAGFEAALDHGESTDAMLGLADALFWQGDAPGCVVHMERAYAALRRAGQQ